MDAELDIELEYAKLHEPGLPHLILDSEERDFLRKEILEAPGSVKYPSGQFLNHLRKRLNIQPLPFEGIKLTSYKEWRLSSAIDKAKNAGRRIYYLRKEQNGELIAFAAGYYDKKQDGGFVVLGNSFFPVYNYISDKAEDKPVFDYWPRNYFYREKEGFCIEKCAQHRYSSASCAARIYLGEGATLAQWKDDSGISLSTDKNYSEPVEVHTIKPISMQQVLFSDEMPPQKAKKRFILDEVISESEDNTTPTPQNKTHHFFLISDNPHYQASGYYSQKDDLFYVCEGSIVSEIGDVSPDRERFNKKACEKLKYGWKVIKDAKCKNASVAAYYVTGNLNADYSIWRDLNGKYLKDYFPKKFFRGNSAQPAETHMGSQSDKGEKAGPRIRWGAHAFYLRTEIGESDVYDAKGYYDPKSGQFTLKEGSLLSLTIKSEKFDQSAAGHLRANIINKNCTRERNGYRLLADETCKDPIFAASIVIGKTINGWNMWKDNKGFFLSVYS